MDLGNNFESPSLSRKRSRLDEENIAIGRAIVGRSFELSNDGNSLSLILEKGRHEVPRTVGAIDALALRTGIINGKWLVHGRRIYTVPAPCYGKNFEA